MTSIPETIPFTIGVSPPSLLGQRYVSKLTPWLTPDLELYAEAVGEAFQQVLELAEEEGEPGTPGWVPSWGKLLNPATCPEQYLFFPAQLAGVELPKEASAAEKREIILKESGLERGTLKSIEAACERVLGPGVPFTIEERTEANGTEGAYHFNVVIPTGKGSTALREAVENQKPGGVMFSILEVTGAWINVAGGKKWSEATPGEKFSEAKEGAP
jgi:hypothetical protein